MRLPARRLGRGELGVRLREGDRRQGVLLYRPSCPACQACEPIRIETDLFLPTRSQTRALRRGNEALDVRLARPSVTPERVELYNRHKVERGLLIGNELIDIEGYQQFLVESCVDTVELSFRLAGELIGIAIVDRADDALSAVYCYFDPGQKRLSPGTYSILKQIELCRTWGLSYLYLGLYVADCAAMAYKSGFFPHERLIGGSWQRFERERNDRISP